MSPQSIANETARNRIARARGLSAELDAVLSMLHQRRHDYHLDLMATYDLQTLQRYLREMATEVDSILAAQAPAPAPVLQAAE